MHHPECLDADVPRELLRIHGLFSDESGWKGMPTEGAAESLIQAHPVGESQFFTSLDDRRHVSIDRPGGIRSSQDLDPGPLGCRVGPFRQVPEAEGRFAPTL